MTTYTAHSILGIQVPLSKVFLEERTKAFEHEHPEDWEYDPHTGQLLWHVQHFPQPGFQTVLWWGEGCALFANRYLAICDVSRKDIAFIALAQSSVRNWDSSMVACSLDYSKLHFSADFAEFKAACQKYDLWGHDSDFGLWTYLQVL